MGLGGKVYNIFFKRSSTYFLTLAAGVFVFERFADGLCDSVFDSINRGMQWKDIKNNYIQQGEESAE